MKLYYDNKHNVYILSIDKSYILTYNGSTLSTRDQSPYRKDIEHDEEDLKTFLKLIFGSSEYSIENDVLKVNNRSYNFANCYAYLSNKLYKRYYSGLIRIKSSYPLSKKPLDLLDKVGIHYVTNHTLTTFDVEHVVVPALLTVNNVDYIYTAGKYISKEGVSLHNCELTEEQLTEHSDESKIVDFLYV